MPRLGINSEACQPDYVVADEHNKDFIYDFYHISRRVDEGYESEKKHKGNQRAQPVSNRLKPRFFKEGHRNEDKDEPPGEEQNVIPVSDRLMLPEFCDQSSKVNVPSWVFLI